MSSVAASTLPHVSVCICTYKRPQLLGRLLEALRNQDTHGLLTYSIVVTDNDAAASSRELVSEFAEGAPVPVVYAIEPRQNIALARNRAVANATGEFIAFIDDDEFPTPSWLRTLFEACRAYGADGVLGPVKPHFDEPPPQWIVSGRFYDRPSYRTGLVIDWRKGRTGNVLLKRTLFDGIERPFHPEFLTGEDQDFFRRMIAQGHVFVWCHEAIAYEVVPPIRWQRRFLLKRALLRGAVSLLHPTAGAVHIGKSLVAVPAYAAALPFMLCAGQGAFMTCLVKLCDHAGRLLAAVGVRPIAEPYVTE